MRAILQTALGLSIILLLPFGVCASQKAKKQTNKLKQRDCWATAMTQFEMNQCAGKELKEAEQEMHRILEKLLESSKSDAEAVENLRAAQAAWEKYRDADTEAWWPGDPRQYGSVHPMCRALHLARLTKERVAVLKDMVKFEEGNVCSSGVAVERSEAGGSGKERCKTLLSRFGATGAYSHGRTLAL